jgi:hypothetical protein
MIRDTPLAIPPGKPNPFRLEYISRCASILRFLLS